jgi:hypothetical protein
MTLYNLCLVSKAFNEVFSPFLFAEIDWSCVIEVEGYAVISLIRLAQRASQLIGVPHLKHVKDFAFNAKFQVILP